MMTSQPKTPAILNDNISRKIPDGSRISYYREFLNARSEGFSLKKCPGNTVQHAYTIGAFHSTRTFETLETAANGTEISRKSFRNPGNGWISEMRTTQPKFLEIFTCKAARKKNFLENFSKIWVYLARLSSFMEIFENAGLFATGSSRKFNNRHEPGFWWNEKRPIFPFEIGSVFEFWNLPISL